LGTGEGKIEEVEGTIVKDADGNVHFEFTDDTGTIYTVDLSQFSGLVGTGATIDPTKCKAKFNSDTGTITFSYEAGGETISEEVPITGVNLTGTAALTDAKVTEIKAAIANAKGLTPDEKLALLNALGVDSSDYTIDLGTVTPIATVGTPEFYGLSEGDRFLASMTSANWTESAA